MIYIEWDQSGIQRQSVQCPWCQETFYQSVPGKIVHVAQSIEQPS